MQRVLDIIRKYCEDWGLDINVSKTSYIFTWEDNCLFSFFFFIKTHLLKLFGIINI